MKLRNRLKWLLPAVSLSKVYSAPQVVTTHNWQAEPTKFKEALAKMKFYDPTETAGNECKGDFDKVLKGKHTKPHWSKGRY